MLKKYWIWFITPIAQESFGVILPSLSLTTCAAMMFVFDKIMGYVILNSTIQGKDEVTIFDFSKMMVKPYLLVTLGLTWGFLVQLILM